MTSRRSKGGVNESSYSSSNGPAPTRDAPGNTFAIRWLQRLLESGSICFMAKEPASPALTRFVASAQKRNPRRRMSEEVKLVDHATSYWVRRISGEVELVDHATRLLGDV
jgi:hypothetical protein